MGKIMYNGRAYGMPIDHKYEWIDLMGTLAVGETSLTISDLSINADSVIDIYTDRYGVSPTNVIITDGQITLTFPPQAVALGVKVRVIPERIEFRTYAKFNGYGVQLPFNIMTDYKITVKFYETSYVNETSILGNSNGDIRAYLAWTEYSNKWYVSNGSGETNFGSWVGEVDHTIVVNNGNNHNELDGEEVTTYSVGNTSVNIIIGSCNPNLTARGWQGFLKEFKINSITTGDLICQLKPATIGNKSCLYDTVSHIVYNVTNLTVMDSPT